jgi:hypothetical protein
MCVCLCDICITLSHAQIAQIHSNPIIVPWAANRLEAALLPHQSRLLFPTGMHFQMSRSEGENALSHFTG